jgi:hypothetical protein
MLPRSHQPARAGWGDLSTPSDALGLEFLHSAIPATSPLPRVAVHSEERCLAAEARVLSVLRVPAQRPSLESLLEARSQHLLFPALSSRG